MKMKRKVLIGSTLAIAVGAMAGGATLTANAMGTTNPDTKFRAIVNTIGPSPDGKGLISCTFTNVDLPSIAIRLDRETGEVPALDAGVAGIRVSAPAGPVSGESEELIGVVGPEKVHSSDGGQTFTITDKDGNTRTITNPGPGIAIAVPAPVLPGSESSLPIPSAVPESLNPPEGFSFELSVPALRGVAVGPNGEPLKVREGSESECAAVKPTTDRSSVPAGSVATVTRN